MSITEMADKIGVDLKYVDEIEQGKRLLSLSSFVKIINVLNISADALLKDCVNADKEYVLNDLTLKMKKLSTEEFKSVARIVENMIDTINNS